MRQLCVSGGLNPKNSGGSEWRRKLATDFGGLFWQLNLAFTEPSLVFNCINIHK